MLREETHAELFWDDGRSIPGLVVVWSGQDDREEFQAWLFSVRRAIPRFYELPFGMEALANGAPWRGLFIARWADRFKGGAHGPVTLLFRGVECRAMSLDGRATTRPSVPLTSDEGSIEYQLLGLPSGTNPCTV